MKKQLTDIKAIPFIGGQNTAVEPALLPTGAYSAVVNMRNMNPGMKKRLGYIKQHSTADSTNKVMSMFQFSKGRRTERHFYAQLSDNDVLEATTAPPGVTTGAFGSEVFSGSASSIPASWSVIDDQMLFSNGVDQHQICAGTTNNVQRFVVYSSASTLPVMPAVGADYTDEVTDSSASTVASLDALGTNATDCILICCPIQPNRLTFTLNANVNDNASVATIKYWNGAWAAVSGGTDGTIISTGKTMSGSGAITFTQPTDAIPRYMYGTNGFWMQITVSAALAATVQVTTCTYGSGWTAIQDIWDGDLNEAIEAQLFHTSYYTLATTDITIGTMTSSDTLCFNFSDPVEWLYIDIGSTPNENASTMTVKYLSTAGTWTTISGITDGTVGVATKSLSQSGYVRLARQSGIKPQQYNNCGYDSYWYQISFSATLSGSALGDISIAIQGVPYFDVSTFGVGMCNVAWKNRAVYTFDKDPSWLVISADNAPQILSGGDSALYQAGDGRANKVVAMKKFYNELITVQEEKGTDGGCVTLISGTTPANLGKLVLSNIYGGMNSRCLVVVDGVVIGENEAATIAFILSKRGILYSDGKGVYHVPNFEKIKNYFDPEESECIRYGYESEMWLSYDSSYNLLKIGLVSGSSASVCNKWLVYDLRLLEFSEDSYANAMACMCECDAASGNVPILQMGGGTADGTVYVLNNTTNDVSTAIDSYVTMEYDGQGRQIHLGEMLLRCKVQSAGTMTITPYYNSIAQTAITKYQTAEVTSQTIRKNRFNVNMKSQHVSLKIQHNTASQSCHLLDIGQYAEEYEDQ